MTNSAIDFGYPWWLSHGHLAIAACALIGLLVGYRRKWPKWPMVFLVTLTLWSGAAFLAVRFTFDLSGAASLPTPNFLRSGVGRVVDLGAGTGRSSIMVLKARPRATLVALDLFADSFEAALRAQRQSAAAIACKPNRGGSGSACDDRGG